MPKIDIPAWTEGAGGFNPLFSRDNGPYAEVTLGDAVGLSQFGVRMERLPPGSRSSHRHWHETEDEFVYIISGEAVLIEDTETTLRAGDAAGWRAGSPVGHCLENRSDGPVTILIVGTRAPAGVVHYPDNDIVLHHDASGRRFTKSDGSPIEPQS
jgi:uncharacterized cupin superfamily protein